MSDKVWLFIVQFCRLGVSLASVLYATYMFKVGSWQYEIRTHSHSQSITILVTTMAADPKIPPIVVKPTLSTTDVTTSKPVVVNAKVRIVEIQSFLEHSRQINIK